MSSCSPHPSPVISDALVRFAFQESMKRMRRAGRPEPIVCSGLSPQQSLQGNDIVHVLGRLYISDHLAARDPQKLRQDNIRHVICTADDVPQSAPVPGVRYYTFPATEKESDRLGMAAYFNELAKLYVMLLVSSHDSENILIHCYAGVNRSATAVAFLLMRFHGFSYTGALHLLRCKRPAVNPSDLHLAHLQRSEQAAPEPTSGAVNPRPVLGRRSGLFLGDV